MPPINSNQGLSHCGWASNLRAFVDTPAHEITQRLLEFMPDCGPAQEVAWRTSVPQLQSECRALISAQVCAESFLILLEYEIPRESRRPDVLILANRVAFVLELKGYSMPRKAFIDQVFAYARDLGCYHRDLDGQRISPFLVLTSSKANPNWQDQVLVTPLVGVHAQILSELSDATNCSFDLSQFLEPEAYRPLPTLVRAARALFEHNPLPTIKRAAAATDPAIQRISEIAHDAARTKTRRLLLISGVPGAGKTLVGLRAVHAGYLEDLAVSRPGGKPSSPAVFLSGNGPLVAVLQDALKDAGGGGKAFVRGVKDYVKFYSNRGAVPLEHLLISDEAQRAWDAVQVVAAHKGPNAPGLKSEPELFIDFASRIPGWCVFVGLIGSGQEIHVGEEGGIVQWRQAVENCSDPGEWIVHAAEVLLSAFNGASMRQVAEPSLSLDTEIRYHMAPMVHDYVETLLEVDNADKARSLAEKLNACGFRFLLTRDLDAAKGYVKQRYADAPEARFGILASSKDKDLPAFGVDNTYFTTMRLKVGPWYNQPSGHPLSCCQMSTVATEFSSQGLELDFVLLAWGSDFIQLAGRWDNSRSRGTRGVVHDPFRLRLNVYRVLLTRGRDGAVIFVPGLQYMDETYSYLLNCGMVPL